uniref:holo-[acyl-carrier-protein] synthase n=1 Tax=Kalanchoe fedtschenkoi TaxID=63787 RepID=A0A7N0UBQ5_KALFE
MLSVCFKGRIGMRIGCLHRSISAPPLVHVQTPSPGETHLWYILPGEVKSASLLDQYFQHLSPCEKENISSMGTEQLKKSALLARTLVRTTIARYQINSEISPSSLKFRKNIYGKPEVDWQHGDNRNQSALHFNLSHTSSLIACGVTSDSPIGIDVEEIQRRLTRDILSFACRYFTPDEVEYLSAISDSEVQKRELLKLWTIKESYVKALGRGFSGAPFKTFNVRYKTSQKGGCGADDHFDSVSEILVEPVDPGDTNLPRNWQFKLLELAGSHYAAICTETNTVEGGSRLRKLKVWKTIPFVEDECVSGTNAAVEIV